MEPLIEICIQNMINGGENLYQILAQDSEVEVLINDCLNCCKTCSHSPFVLVEGELVVGKDEQELLENIKQHLKEIKQ